MGKRLDKTLATVVVAPEAALMAVADVCIAAARAHRMFRTRIAQELSEPQDVQTALDGYLDRKRKQEQKEVDREDFMAPKRAPHDDRAPGLAMVD